MGKKQKEAVNLPWHDLKVSDTPFGAAIQISQLVANYMVSDRFNNLSDRSKSQYRSILRKLESFELYEGKPLFQMNAHLINYEKADYIQRILSFRLAPATVALYFAFLTNIWHLALRNQSVAYNPWTSARIKIDNERDVIWEKSQIDLAVTTANELGFNLLALFIKMAHATGQRPWSDLKKLKWENFKLDNTGTFVLDFTIQKTNQKIMIPLSEEVGKLISELPRLSEYIFVTKKGKSIDASTARRQLDIVKAKAGLDPNLMLRDLRRTAVTELAMSGATVSEITAIIGWRVSDKIINRYAVVKLNTAKNALKKREEYAKTLSNSREVLSNVTPKT